MLRSHGLTRELLHGLLGHVGQSHHAHGLPDTQTNAWGHTTVETADTARLVNVAEGVADRHLLGSVGIVLLRLHLHTHDFDGLVPGAETTAEGGSEDALWCGQLLLGVGLAGEAADSVLTRSIVSKWHFILGYASNVRNSAKTETRSPVGDLSHSHSVDTLVDTTNTLGTVDGHEALNRARGLLARLCGLVLGHFHSLHARAETHGSIGLSKTTSHTPQDTSREVVRAKGLGVVFGLGGHEQEDSALGGGFDPGPWDETLVDCACV